MVHSTPQKPLFGLGQYIMHARNLIEDFLKLLNVFFIQNISFFSIYMYNMREILESVECKLVFDVGWFHRITSFVLCYPWKII